MDIDSMIEKLNPKQKYISIDLGRNITSEKSSKVEDIIHKNREK
jgi:hypothetical protein